MYSRAATDEFGYNVGQLPIKFENDTVKFTCFVSKTVYPVIWNKVDVSGLSEPIQIANAREITIKDPRFSITVGNKGLIHILKVDINTCTYHRRYVRLDFSCYLYYKKTISAREY